MSGKIPVATNTHIVVVGNDVNHAWVVGKFVNGFACAVGREVVYHHEVEFEVGFLIEHALDGVANGANAVAHGNHHCGFHFKFATVEFNVLEVGCAISLYRGQIATNFLEVFGAGLFHLNLATTVFGVYVVENLFATLAGVELHIAVEEFVDVGDGGKLREFETQVVEPGKLILCFHSICRFLKAASTEEEH